MSVKAILIGTLVGLAGHFTAPPASGRQTRGSRTAGARPGLRKTTKATGRSGNFAPQQAGPNHAVQSAASTIGQASSTEPTEPTAFILAPSPNDNCTAAAPITGEGTFVYDTSMATGDLCPDGITLGCPEHVQAEPAGCVDSLLGPKGTIDHDLWFCWTSPCDGAVQVDTCGGSVDTKLAVYGGCSCPVSDAMLLGCDDDADTCGLQSLVTFRALMGQNYLIRVGTSPGFLGAPDAFQVTCLNAPCSEPVGNCQGTDFSSGALSDRTGVTAADNFTPAADGNITHICWSGAYRNDEIVPDTFEIRYYSDADGIPGSLIGGPFAQASASLQVTGPVLAGNFLFPVFGYSAIHTAVPVTAGQCYWVEITNATNRFGEWFWQFGSGGNGSFAEDGANTPTINGYDAGDLSFGDLSFCLDVPLGDAGACPPPPSAACSGPTNNCCTGQTLTSGIVGCNDNICCRKICFCDDFCCKVAWDNGCATNGSAGTRRCSDSQRSCTADTDCMTCSTSLIPCTSSAQCPQGESCVLVQTCDGCGAAVQCANVCSTCPDTAINWMDPPNGVVDARAPHDRSDVQVLKGIDHLVISATHDVTGLACWSLCETANTGTSNAVTNVAMNTDGTFTVQLARPLTGGAVTRVTYTPDIGIAQTATLISHPGNVNADSQTASQDITKLIDYCLNGVGTPPFGIYSCDTNNSGAVNAQDITGLIDLLNGAGAFSPWVNTPLPSGPCLP